MVYQEFRKLVLEFELQVKNNIDFYYDSEYYERIVKWYIDNHKFKLGLKAIEIALAQHKFSSDLLIQKANILIALQKFSKALISLDKAHSLNPKDENIFILTLPSFNFKIIIFSFAYKLLVKISIKKNTLKNLCISIF